MNCPACNSNDFNTIFSKKYLDYQIIKYLTTFYAGRVETDYLKDEMFILNECNSCGLIFQENVPNNLLMKKIYDKWIDPSLSLLKSKQFKLDYYSNLSQEIMMLIGYFNIEPNLLSFFDFGMGWARWMLLVKGFGVNSYGTELSTERIQYAKENGIKVVNWEEIPNYQFDFINTDQVFEHILNPLETLKHLRKAFKQNGLLKISVPNGNNIKKRLKIMDWNAPKGNKKSLNPVAPLEHINCYNTKSLINMAQNAGLRLVSIPIITQYKYCIKLYSFKAFCKSIIKTIYINFFRKGTNLFFTKS